MMGRLLLLCLLSLFSAVSLSAQESALLRSREPISLTSDQLATDSANRTAVFSGRVVARQGDLTIACDRLTVRYGAKGNDVEEVLAVGAVRISQGNRLAFAGRALYDNRAGIIRLEEQPSIQQGEDRIAGVTIIYYVNEQKSVVSGGPGRRVEAVIRPEGERVREPVAR